MNDCDKQLGIYVHIPFCVRKCVYCDFLSSPYTEQAQKQYVDKLCWEIEESAKRSDNLYVDSIFIGGGTPSLLSAELIARIIYTIRHNYNVSEYAEITIECNPGTLDEDKAYEYRECGINRISFGLQSTDDSKLKMLGRIHDLATFDKSYNIARQYGFNNINIDMMMSLPGQTQEEFDSELRTVLAYKPEHLSVYSLIVEEGTYLYEHLREFPPLPSDDDDRFMYRSMIKLLAEYGYKQYEISNFAREGYECRHNIGYWDRADYIGFGLGAASLVGPSVRYSNIRDMDRYLSACSLDDIRTEKTKLTVDDCMEEFVFLGLRKTCGIDIDRFYALFGVRLDEVYSDELKKNIASGLLARRDNRVSLTPRGVDISNTVMADFLR